MLPTTYDAVKAVLRADPTISTADRNRLLAALRSDPDTSQTSLQAEPRLIRRREAARRLSFSIRTVDKLAATGVLKKRTLPGRVRASGFLEADVEALIKG